MVSILELKESARRFLTPRSPLRFLITSEDNEIELTDYLYKAGIFVRLLYKECISDSIPKEEE